MRMSSEIQGGLRRELGLGGAVLMGLGSILGTGVFVSIGIAAGITGPSVVLAVALAAVIAACNGLSSAQLAADHPVSGGTYEYGHKYLDPRLGFAAGWMFLCAKSASAATAALGFAGYLLGAAGVHERAWRIAVAVAAVATLTLVVAGGIRRSNRTNIAIVSVTIAALLAFIATALPAALRHATDSFVPFFAFDGAVSGHGAAGKASGLFHATALMFVAFTGYGRIATLGEEVRAPRTTIPRAIIITLVASALLYMAVAAVAVGAAGPAGLAGATRTAAAPLEVIARAVGPRWLALIVAAGALTAMLGVLLNLLLGLSRVLLAMARRRDMPGALAGVHEGTPRAAVLVVGAIIAGLALIGNVKTTWSFSAFTVLVYYAITNLSALRLPAAARRYPRWVAMLGLVASVFMAFWVEPAVWLSGLGLLALGFVWRAALRARRR
jgi:APA family basic amino acid/polyamine antiporter